MLVRLQKENIEKIQIDEGIVVFDLGNPEQNILAPTRGGAEFTATPSIRDIEYDGRPGKTKGVQVKDGEDVTLKVVSIDCSAEVLAKAIPNVVLSGDNKVIEPGDFGLIKDENYINSVSVITQMLDGTYAILTVYNVMHEGAFGFKTVQKSENEHNLELIGHYDMSNPQKKLWKLEYSDTNPLT